MEVPWHTRWRVIMSLALLILLAGSLPATEAVSYTLSGKIQSSSLPTLQWSNAQIWTPSGVPGPNDNVTIRNTNSVSGCRLQIVSNITINSLTMTDTDSRTCSLEVLNGIGLTVTGTLTHGAQNIYVSGAVQVNNFVFYGSNIQGPFSQSSTLLPNRGTITITGTLFIRRGSSSSKYLRYIRIINSGSGSFSSDMSRQRLYCQGCIFENRGIMTLAESYYYLTGTNPSADADGFRRGIVNTGTLVFPMYYSSSTYFYWDLKNLGTFNTVTMRWGSRYRLYCSQNSQIWINQGTINIYMAELFMRYGYIMGRGGTINFYGQPAIWDSYPRSPVGANNPAMWSQYIQDAFGDISSNMYFWNTNYISYFNFYPNVGLNFDLGTLNTYGRIRIYMYLYYSSSQPRQASVSGGLNLSPDTEFIAYGGVSTGVSNQQIAVGGSSPSLGSMQIYGGCQVRVTSTSPIRVNRRVTVYQYSVLELNSPSAKNFYDKVFVSGNGQLSLVRGTGAFYSQLFVDATLNATSAGLITHSTFVWQSGMLAGNSQSSLITSGPAYISSSTTLKQLQGLTLNILRQPLPATGQVIAEYFQYRVATNRTQRKSYIQYWPGQSTSSTALPRDFDNSTTVPTLARLESRIQRPPSRYGSAPLQWSASSSYSSVTYGSNDIFSFPFTYATRIWFFLQIDTPGQYSFYINNGYSIAARLWIDGVVQSPTFNPYRSRNVNPTDNRPINATLEAGTVRMRLDYFTRTTSYWDTYGQMLLISYSSANMEKQYIPLNKVSWRRLVNGQIDYANPNAFSNITTQTSQLNMMHESLFLLVDAPTISVASTGLLNVLVDASLIGEVDLSGAHRSQLINAGEVRKTGTAGVATFFMNYVAQGGRINNLVGKIEFSSTTGGLVRWNNTAGGSWLDASNWSPKRVPSANDIVFISAQGSYSVIVTGDITVDSIYVGDGGSSNPTLTLGHYAKLNVTDRMDVHADTLAINGQLNVVNMIFSGLSITGTGAGSMIVARSSFAVVARSSGNRFFRDVVIQNMGSFAIDVSLDRGLLYCAGCKLINNAGATMLFNGIRFYWQTGSCTTSSLTATGSTNNPCAQSGLVNNGLVTVEIYSQSPTWQYMRIYGSGILRAVTIRWRSGYSFYMNYPYLSGGTLQIYSTNLWIGYTRSPNLIQLDKLEAYGAKYYPRTPDGANTRGGSATFINTLYGNASVPYDIGYTSCRIYLRNLYGSSANLMNINIGTLSTFGRTFILNSNSYNIRLALSGSLNLSPWTTMTLPDLSGRWAAISLPKTATLSSLVLGQNWYVEGPTGSSLTCTNVLNIRNNGTLILNSSAVMLKNVFVASNGNLRTSSGSVRVTGYFQSYGSVDFGTASTEVSGTWWYAQGSLSGSSVASSGQWRIQGSGGKDLYGLSAQITQPGALSSPLAERQGVIAEYFQMRINSAQNPTPSGTPRNFPPFSGFDDSSTRPIYWRFEQDISHQQSIDNWAPVQYSSSSTSANTSSLFTFQYNFAVRYWTWLKIPTTGLYQFSLRSDYGVRPRLWIDNSIVLTGSHYQWITRASTPRRVAMNLTAGYHRLRLDLLQISSYYSTYNGMLVYMSGPGIAEAVIPTRFMFATAAVGGSAVALAQPALNASFARQNFATTMSGSEIISWAASSFMIARNALMDVQSDVSFLCYATAPCSIINYGTLRRSGAFGPSVFYVTYDNKSVGILDQQVSSLTFSASQVGASRITWISTSDGSWSNASNWLPKRVPQPGDTVLIRTPGTYVVHIPDSVNANVSSVLVGSSGSGPTLEVSHLASLTVTDRLELGGSTVNINGFIDANVVVWSGSRMTSSPLAVGQRSLIVRKSILISGTTSPTKYLSYVTIENHGILSQDYVGSSSNMYCLNCNIKTMAGASSIFTTRYFRYSGGQQADSTGYRAGFENYGNLVFRPGANTLYLYWDVKNYGRVVTMPFYYLARPTIYFYNVWMNYGKVDVYVSSLRTYTTSGFRAPKMTATVGGSSMSTQSGAWNIYSYPLVYNTRNIRGNRAALLWSEWLEDTFSSGLYTGSQVQVYFYNNNRNLYFGSLNTFGNVFIQSNYGYNNFNITVGSLNMDPSGTLNLYRSRGSVPGSSFVLEKAPQPHQIGFFYSYYWNGLVVNGDAVFAGGVSLSTYGRLFVQSQGNVAFRQHVVMSHSSAQFSIRGANAFFYDMLRLVSGTFTIPSSTVVLMNKMEWTSAVVSGVGGRLVVARDSQVSGNSRQLQDVSLVIDGIQVNSQMRGFIAEYFQYWALGTRAYFYGERTSSALPSSFDNPSQQPNFYRFENYVQRFARYYGDAPKYITNGANSMSNRYYSTSFTYRYAARLFAYLDVPTTGSYMFYFKTGYSLRARMWIDGRKLYTSPTGLRSPTATDEQTPAISLSAGMHWLRIDFLVPYSSFLTTNGAMLLISWSGPSISKTYLPVSRLYPFILNSTTSTYQAAAPSAQYSPPVSGICNTTYSVSQALTRPFSYSRLYSIGGLTTSRNGQILVRSRGILDLATSTSWSLTSPPLKLFIDGMVARSAGSGLLNLNTLYNLTASGCQRATSGSLELGVNSLGATAPTVSGTGTVPVPTVGTTQPPVYPPGVTVTWNGTRSGDWSDRSNWDVRVPSGNDDVILPDTRLTVTISGNVVVRSLTVGSAPATTTIYMYLRVNAGASLTVSDTLQLNSYQSYIYGSVTAGRLEWRGYRLYGNTNGKLTVQNSGTIIRDRYASKYLYQLEVINKGLFVVDDSMNNANYRLYFANSLFTNEGTFLTNAMALRSTSNNFPFNTLNIPYDNGQPRHLTNSGNFTMVLSSFRYTYLYLSMYNTGMVKFVSTTYRSSATVYFYAMPIQIGRMTSYFTSLYWYANQNYGPTLSLDSGRVELFSYPLRLPGLGNPPTPSNISNYQSYIDGVFSNASSTLWDMDFQTRFYLLSVNNQQINGGTVVTHGYALVQISSSSGSTFSGFLLQQDYAGYFLLGGTSGTANSISFNASSTTNTLYGNSGWWITMPQSLVTNFLYGQGTVNCGITVTGGTSSLQRLFLATPCSLTLNSASLTAGIADVYGSINLVNGGVLTASDLFRWSSGSLIGTGSGNRLVLPGYTNITGFNLKSHDNVDVVFSTKTIPTSAQGVVSQYFHYRDTGSNSTASPTYLNYFPGPDGSLSTGYLPSSFDDLSTPASFQRVENTVQRRPGYYLNRIDLFSDNGGLDTTPDLSFSRVFAVRMLSYLTIDTTGDYTFYLRYRNGPARLWIDGQVVFTGPRSASISSEMASNATRLTAGVHLLRVDVILSTDSNVLYGANVLVSYSSASVSKQLIPSSKLRIYNGQTPASQAIVNMMLPQQALVNSEAIIARSGASVTVQANRQVYIAGDVLWLSVFSSKTSSMNLMGSLVKVGGGIGTFYMNYVASGSGGLVQTDGSIQFTVPSLSNVPLFWNNSAGGMWNDATNWYPKRVPSAGSIVFIDLPGAYSIIVPTGTTVRVEDLIIGGQNTNAQLYVGAQASIVVNDRLDLVSSNFAILGSVDAGRITLGGQYITGSSTSFASSTLTIRKSLSFLSNQIGSIYLQNILIRNYGTMTLGTTVRDITIYCQACTVVNNGVIVVKRAHLRNNGALPAYDGNNFRMGVQNMAQGSFYWDLISSRSFYSYWDFMNAGTMGVVGKGSYPSNYRVYFYGTLTNLGTVSVYSSSFYLYSHSNNNRNFQKGAGDFALYGLPQWNATAGPRPYSLEPAQYIARVFGSAANTGSTLWEANSASVLLFYGFLRSTVSFGSLRGIGFSTIQFSYCRYSSFSVTRQLDVSSMNRLQFSGTSGGRSTFKAASVLRLGAIYNTGYWTVSFTPGTAVLPVYDLFTLSGNASVAFTASSPNTIRFYRDISVPSATALSFGGNSVVFNRRLVTAGDVSFVNSGALLQGALLWRGGSLTGSSPANSYITLGGGGSLNGVNSRTLDNINLGIQSVQPSSTNGVIAEYFTFPDDSRDEIRLGSVNYYWQFNDTRCTDNNQCIPASFDSPTTPGQNMRLESSFSLTQVQLYPGPVSFTNTGSIDGSSYSYNYGVRRSAYLQVAASGMYRFTVVAYYRVPRVWVNGVVLATGNSYSSDGNPAFVTPFVFMPAGSNLIRIDTIVRSSSRNGLAVYYEGPGVPLQMIPRNKQFYASPSNGQFASPLWQASSRSTCTVLDDSVTIMRRGAVLNVTSSGSIDLQTDSLWYSANLATSPGRVINAGSITKSNGTGVALFLAQYSGSGRIGSQVRVLSNTASGGVVFWNNPNGGLWSEPSNWMPQRVPTANDYVYITEPGAYKVVVDAAKGGGTCLQLDVGAADAQVNFVVDYFSSLTVTRKLFLNSRTTLLHGSVKAGSISWSGLSITGQSHSAQPVSITASEGFVASGRSYSTRTLTNVLISMGGNSVWDQTIYSLALSGTTMAVLPGGTWITSIRFFGRSLSRLRVFSTGLINHGTVVFASQSTFYMYGDLINYGTVYFGRNCVTSSGSVRLYGYFSNMSPSSLIRFYNSYVYFYSQVTLPGTSQGTIEVWGSPFTRATIPGNCDITQFFTSFNAFYSTSLYSNLYAGSDIVWNTASQRTVYIYEQGSNSANFSTFRTRGRVDVRVYYRSNSNITFSTALDLGPQSTLTMYSGRQRGANGRFFMPASVTLGTWTLNTGWTLEIPTSVAMTVAKDFVLRPGIAFSVTGGSLNFLSAFVVPSGATLSAQDTSITVGGNVFHYGTMNLVSCNVDFGHDMWWSRGSIQGRDTWIYIRRRVTSSSTSPLRLVGTNMRVVLEGQVPRPSESRGVLAEYFQYRNGPERRISLTGFFNDSTRADYNTPQSFDDPTTEPTYSRVEPSVSYIGEYIGHSPLFYTSLSPDTSSMYTFQWNFAVRYTFYAYIPVTSSNYRIHFSGPYYTAKYARVWVNDSSPSATVRAGYYPSSVSVSDIAFRRGYNKIRVDVTQTSSYYTSAGNMFYVAYELPGILPKTLLNNRNTYYRQSPYWTGTGSPYPAPSFQVLTVPTCQYEAPNATNQLCNNFDLGVSCWRVGAQSYVDSSGGPSVWVTKSGVLDVTSTGNWTWNNTRMSLLGSGIIARTNNPSPVYLNTQYAMSGGCTRLQAGTQASNLNIGLSSAAATFPPTTEPPPTLPPPTTQPPVQERGPSSWTSDDVQEFIATAGGGEYADLGQYFSGYSGSQLVALSREDFLNLVPPAQAALAGQLYDALVTQRQTYEPSTGSSSTTGIAVGVAVGVVVLIVVIVLIVIIVRRGSGGHQDQSVMFTGRRSQRLSEQPVMQVENPGYMNQSYSTTSLQSQKSTDTTKLSGAAEKGEMMYDEAAMAPDANPVYEDVGAMPGHYANTKPRGGAGDTDFYEVMG